MPRAQLDVEIRRPLDQRTEAGLAHPQITLGDFELRIEGMAEIARAKGLPHARPPFLAGEMAEPDRPRLFGLRRDRVLDPHDPAAGRARRPGEAVDVRHDLARLRHLGRLARRHEAVLQIDNDERGARRIEIIEGMQAAAAGQRPLDRPGWDFDLVHGPFLATVSRLLSARAENTFSAARAMASSRHGRRARDYSMDAFYASVEQCDNPELRVNRWRSADRANVPLLRPQRNVAIDRLLVLRGARHSIHSLCFLCQSSIDSSG